MPTPFATPLPAASPAPVSPPPLRLLQRRVRPPRPQHVPAPAPRGWAALGAMLGRWFLGR
jgi:hypothetical protein